MQTTLYGKIKESRETGGEWLIGANTQNILYLPIVATQHKTRQRRVWRILMRVTARRRVLIMDKACRRVSMMGKAHRCEGAQSSQFSRLLFKM